MTDVGTGGFPYGPNTVAYAPPVAVTTISFIPPTNLLPLLSVSQRRNCFPFMSSSMIAPGSSVQASRNVLVFVSARPLCPQPLVSFNTVLVLPSHFESVFETQAT